MMQAGEEIVNLSGTWILDPSHSKMEHTPPGTHKLKISIGGGYPGSPDENDGNNFPEEPPGGRIENLTLLIVQTNSEVQTMRQFTIDGLQQAVPQKFALDGSQCINLASDGRGEFVSRTAWKNDKLINSGAQTITMPGQRIEISLKEEYSISKNGKRLTIQTMSATPRGVTTQKQVFNKRE